MASCDLEFSAEGNPTEETERSAGTNGSVEDIYARIASIVSHAPSYLSRGFGIYRLPGDLTSIKPFLPDTLYVQQSLPATLRRGAEPDC